MLARLKNDFELAEFGFKSRTAQDWWGGLSSTPETVQLMAGNVQGDRVRLTGKRVCTLNEEQRRALKRINLDPAYRYIIVPRAGWFNTGEWKAESLGFGDNLVEVLRIVGRHAEIKTIDYYTNPFPGIDHHTNPELVHRMTVVTRKGTLIRPGRGLDVYIFLISKVPMWIPVSRLDFVNLKPISPIGYSKIVVVHVPFTKIRQRPSEDSPLNYRAWIGSRWQITDTHNGWGSIPGRGWINLKDVREV